MAGGSSGGSFRGCIGSGFCGAHLAIADIADEHRLVQECCLCGRVHLPEDQALCFNHLFTQSSVVRMVGAAFPCCPHVQCSYAIDIAPPPRPEGTECHPYHSGQILVAATPALPMTCCLSVTNQSPIAAPFCGSSWQARGVSGKRNVEVSWPCRREIPRRLRGSG
jgi:hypothetical protein